MPVESQPIIWAYFAKCQLACDLKQLGCAFDSFQIRFVTIKGISIWRWYPEGALRNSNDIDISVENIDWEKAREVLDTGIKISKNVDLHCGLRKLDTLEWNDFYSRCDLIEVENVQVRVPCAEDNLRIMAVHWLNDGGQYNERLWDIYYAVENRPETFDWSECLDVVSPTRRKWVITTIGLAHRYLDLNIDDLPFAGEAKQIPNWIIKTVDKEWETDVRLIPLHAVIRQPHRFMQQLKKRFPPNPIQATIEAEGEFDDRSRVYYQLRSIFVRLVPSLQRIIPVLMRRRLSE